MEVTLLYFDGCANWETAEERLSEVLGDLEIESRVKRRLVENYEEAERLGFIGSPTILIDGEDPFAEPSAQIGFACRVFETEKGREGAPSVAQLRAAVEERKD